MPSGPRNAGSGWSAPHARAAAEASAVKLDCVRPRMGRRGYMNPRRAPPRETPRASAASKPSMTTPFAPRPFGSTPLRVSPLGLGSSYGLSGKDVERAHERGVTFFLWGSRRRGDFGVGLRNVVRRDRESAVVAIQSYTRAGWMMRFGVERALRALACFATTPRIPAPSARSFPTCPSEALRAAPARSPSATRWASLLDPRGCAAWVRTSATRRRTRRAASAWRSRTAWRKRSRAARRRSSSPPGE